MDGSAGDVAPQEPYGGGREPLPPSWDGLEPSSTFPVFEKNVRLWEFETELDEKKRGVRLLRCLSGVARAAADSLDFDQLTTSKGVQNIMECLKEQFAPHLEQSLPRAFEKAIYGAPRSHKETMQEYIIRMERSFHTLEKEGVSLPEVALGYVMYRQASLSENQDLRYGAWAQGKYDKKTVISCLRKLDRVADSKKGAATYLQEEETTVDDAANYFDEDIQEFIGDGDENHIYIEEGDMDRIYSEEEVQMALATYQEGRKAIQANQKGRKFYKGGQSGKGRGAQQGNEYYKNKQRVHIEQLKLRTRCARCGTIGHWARECRLPPDEKGKQHLSSASSATSKAAPSVSSAGGKSWFVASEAGSGTLLGASEEFLCFQCRGYCTDRGLFENPIYKRKEADGLICQDEQFPGPLLRGFCERGLELCPPADLSYVDDAGEGVHLFVGLTTSPASAIVDTAAQDGLIGKDALERLKRQLAEHGLRVVMTNKQARAHGVGGPAKAIGIVAIPLGLAGSSGVLEATVVENDVPLLLPIKLLRSLHAVIDVGRSCITFQELGESLELYNLPSGHVAVDVLNFGNEGFRLPKDAHEAGFD